MLSRSLGLIRDIELIFFLETPNLNPKPTLNTKVDQVLSRCMGLTRDIELSIVRE